MRYELATFSRHEREYVTMVIEADHVLPVSGDSSLVKFFQDDKLVAMVDCFDGVFAVDEEGKRVAVVTEVSRRPMKRRRVTRRKTKVDNSVNKAIRETKKIAKTAKATTKKKTKR